jgi:hypothetical protein
MGVAALVRFGKLTAEQGEHFRLMYARCRTDAEFEQVRKAIESFTTRSVPTRFTRILDEDFLGDEV